MVANGIEVERMRITLQGAVQGVGFRPTVYRLASRLRMTGWVRNTNAGLEIEVEGSSEQLAVFVHQLTAERPGAAVVTTEEMLQVQPLGEDDFRILKTDANRSAPPITSVLPDIATCADCVAEIIDSSSRRFGYPFTNCTLCGPRYTILRDIPYDRPNTTMRKFAMCPACRGEYDSYQDRRFHAQPNACALCGPSLTVWPSATDSASPLIQAAKALTQGEIVALKGIGGFQLVVDARNSFAVKRLRERKHRDHKPFAVLMPSIDCVRLYCDVSPVEGELLMSQAAPIVLLRPKDVHDLAPEIAQFSPCLGVMLPYSPIHHLLMALYPFPVVATSGNSMGEPIAIDNDEAFKRLQGIADLFVLHDRPITRTCDDSVVRVLDHPQILRRARGYAPLPVLSPCKLRPVLAVGGHLKNTVAIALDRQVFLSQHIGDLDSLESRDAFERAIEDLCKLYRFEPVTIASDLHPDYASTRWAEDRAKSSGLPLVQVQHHHAHIASCAAENGLESDYLGVAWDGSGFGLNGTIWGGEFFVCGPLGFERIAHLRTFSLPGGEAAIRDCSRPAASLMWETFGRHHATGTIEPKIEALLANGSRGPLTSSVGRLFDAVAYLAGVGLQNLFEGQAAMLLESAIGRTQSDDCYEIAQANGIGDWASTIEEIFADKQRGVDASTIALKFHNALANWILAVAHESGVRYVVLSGGVFQNAYLIMRSRSVLEANGFKVFTHHQVPANDGGLALGQAVLAGQMK